MASALLFSVMLLAAIEIVGAAVADSYVEPVLGLLLDLMAVLDGLRWRFADLMLASYALA